MKPVYTITELQKRLKLVQSENDRLALELHKAYEKIMTLQLENAKRTEMGASFENNLQDRLDV